MLHLAFNLLCCGRGVQSEGSRLRHAQLDPPPSRFGSLAHAFTGRRPPRRDGISKRIVLSRLHGRHANNPTGPAWSTGACFRLTLCRAPIGCESRFPSSGRPALRFYDHSDISRGLGRRKPSHTLTTHPPASPNYGIQSRAFATASRQSAMSIEVARCICTRAGWLLVDKAAASLPIHAAACSHLPSEGCFYSLSLFSCIYLACVFCRAQKNVVLRCRCDSHRRRGK